MAAPEVTPAPAPAAPAPAAAAAAPAPAPPASPPAAKNPGGAGRFFRRFFGGLGRALLTLAVVAAAAALCFHLWREYEQNPWTRDGQIQADIVGIAARVSAPLIKVHVRDNQAVRVGDPLFELDPATFAAQVAALEAQLVLAQTKTVEAFREAERRRELAADQFVSVEDYQRAQAIYKEDLAAERAIAAELEIARLNLSYTKVASTVNGYVTNMHLAAGTYVTAGQPLMALVDTDSYYIYGFFEETVLDNIRLGDRAVMEPMGYRGQKLFGEVESIGWAIFREDGAPVDLLPEISPTIDWVRLAQRFPVRVKITRVPPGFNLRAGQTVSVIVLPRDGTEADLPAWERWIQSLEIGE